MVIIIWHSTYMDQKFYLELFSIISFLNLWKEYIKSMLRLSEVRYNYVTTCICIWSVTCPIIGWHSYRISDIYIKYRWLFLLKEILSVGFF